MVPRRISRIAEHGFTVIELVVVIGVLGIISAIAIPNFLSYLQAAQTRGAAQEVATLLNQARQLAITRNRSVMVAFPAAFPVNSVAFVFTTALPGDLICPNATRCWIGPGTNANGFITLSNNAVITGSTGGAITFSSLGAATPATRITVQNQAATSTMDVVTNPTGRVRVTCSNVAACP
jgi:prepilin-type N-terminal cleavage/methylation domain-containing protein